MLVVTIIMGLVIALYVARIVSFGFPHVVDLYCLAYFVVVFSMCLMYVSLGSIVSSNIFVLMFIGRVVLYMCSASCVLYSVGSDMKTVRSFLSGLRIRIFLCGMCISCRYD